VSTVLTGLRKIKICIYVQPVLFLKVILETVVWFLFNTQDVSQVNAMTFE